MNSIVNLNSKVMKANNKARNIWDIMYEHYKDQYTRKQIDEMTFAELGELIDGLEK